MKLLKYIGLAASLLICVSARAEFDQCYNLKVLSAGVQLTRDSNNIGYENHMVVKFEQKCAGQQDAHLPMNHPNMEHFLMVAMAAKTADLKVNVGVNTNNFITARDGDGANELAYLSFAY